MFALAPKVLVLPTYSYLGVRALVDELVAQARLEVRRVDIADTASVIDACPGADVVWVESPTNPTLDVADLPAIAAAARAAGARVVADNTFATPICAQPLDDGATVVIHSGTKFIGGHSDLMIGLAVTRDDAVHDRLRQTRLVNGSTPGALEAFLALRGVRTLPLRMERSQANAVGARRPPPRPPGRRGGPLPGFRGDGRVRGSRRRRRGRRGLFAPFALMIRRRVSAASRRPSNGARSTPAMPMSRPG